MHSLALLRPVPGFEGGGLGGPTSIGEENECLQGYGPRKGWIVRPHIDWREERMSARTLGPAGGGL